MAGIASRILASMLLCLCAVLAQAQPQEPSKPEDVFPALTGRVVDNAGLLDAATITRLDGVLAAHEAATTNQVVVVTLQSLGGTAIENFGYQLGRAWGIGQRGKDNGVLLIVSRDDRKLRIEVGYGLEGRLTDADASAIINQTITPAFRQHDYAGGIERGVALILQKLGSPVSGAPVGQRATPTRNLSERIVGYVVLLVGGGIMLSFVVFLVSRINAFRRKSPEIKALMLGAKASGAARQGRRSKGSTRASSVSSSSSSSSSSSRSSSRSSRGGGSFGGGGASGGW